MKKILTLCAALMTTMFLCAETIFSFTVTSSTTGAGTYDAEGGTAKCTKAMATGGSNEVVVGDQTFYKFNSSSAWEFTLSSGNFEAGDVISLTGACAENKNGKGFLVNEAITVTGDFVAATANTLTYTVIAGDSIEGKATIKLKRNDADIKFGTIRVDREGASANPVLNVSVASVDLIVSPSLSNPSASVKFTGKNLTAGNYALTVPNIAGLVVSPTSVTVGADGKLNADVLISYASMNDVEKDSTQISLTIDGLTKVVKVNYAAMNQYCGELIKATTQQVVSGTAGGKVVTNLSKGDEKKLDKSKYFGIVLANTALAAGDVFVMNITTAPDSAHIMGTMKLYGDKDGTRLLYEADSLNVGVVGVNRWTLPESIAGDTALYIVRPNGADWNPTFSYIAVERECAPVVPCTAPTTALTLLASKTTDVKEGDEITFSTEGGNGATVTIKGSNGEAIVANKWIATVGQHTFVATQERNENTCGGMSQLVITATEVPCVAPAQKLGLGVNKSEGLYVGDTVTFTISGGNGGATTLVGAASEVIENNQWIAIAGEHSFTLSQAAYNGQCGDDTTIVLNVAVKTPVVAAVVDGENEMMVGDTIVLTCTAEYATAYQWYLNNAAIEGATQATYEFVAAAAGSYVFACEASNHFNASPVKSADLTVTVAEQPVLPQGHWRFSGGDAPAVDGYEEGTNMKVEFLTTDASKSYSKESATYNSAVADDMKSQGKNGLKLGGNALYLKVTLKDGDFQEGDSVIICGYLPWKVSSSSQLSGDVAASITTGESKTDYNVGSFVLADDYDALYFSRATSSSTCVSAIKVIRPEDIVGTPTLKVSANSATVKATAAEPTATAKVVFSGKHLTPGTYNFALTQVEGLSVSPASVTVPENGKFRQEVTITFAATKDVSMSMAELSLTINDIKQSVLISYSASMTKNYGKSIDFEQFVVENGVSGDFATALAAGNYIASLSGFSLDSLNSAKEGNNEPYLGLKIKAANAYVGCWLQKGDTISIKFGKVSANVEFTAGEQSMTKTPDDLVNPFEFIAADADTYVKLQTTSGEAVVIKHILIAGEKHEDQAITNVDAATKAVKVLRNGQLLIIRGDKTYTLTGMEL